MVMIPMCEYPDISGLDGVDQHSFDLSKTAAGLTRDLFSSLSPFNSPSIQTLFTSIQSLIHDLDPLSPTVEWCPAIEAYFMSLDVFLSVRFMAKESDGTTECEYETSAAEILALSAKEHIHSGCPFHLEDCFTHGCMAMFRILSRHHEFTEYQLFQKGVCALFHDIGKGNTRTVSKSGTVGFPCHCIVGSITLRHMWGAHYLPWFTAEEWDLMCDTVLYHMCGPNRAPHPLTSRLLATLPRGLRMSLYDLAQADSAGAVRMQNVKSDTVCFGDDERAREKVEALASTGVGLADLMKCGELGGRPLKGILIVLMGTSACGKSYTASLLRAQMESLGVPSGCIHHLQRDVFIHSTGAALLGKRQEDVSYKEAYECVQEIASREKEQGVKSGGVKSKVSSQMCQQANKLLLHGQVVLFDTMQTFYAGARSQIMPPAAVDALRVHIYPVRPALLQDSDCARHDMTYERQVATSGPFSILHPFSSQMKGTRFSTLTSLRPVWASEFPEKYLSTQCPHLTCTATTLSRRGQELPNLFLQFLSTEIAQCFRSVPEFNISDNGNSLYEDMNMPQLLNTLQRELSARFQTQEEVSKSLKEWFNANQYTVSFPFSSLHRIASYALAVKVGDVALATEYFSRIAPGYSVPSSVDISEVSLHDWEQRVAQLERLANSCMIIKYKDGVNRQWTAPWNIQSRSPVCLLVRDEWRVVSAMPRGPEIAGDKEHGITDLQDLNVNSEEDISHFATHYQLSIRAMQGDEEAALGIDECVCSSKRDGMCFRVMFMAAGTPECSFWQSAAKYVSDDFVSAFIHSSRRVLRGGLLIPASNGTAMLTQRNIQYWMACSMALSYNITHTELLKASKSGLSPSELLSIQVPPRRFGTSETLCSMSLLDAFIHDIASIAGKLSSVEMHAWEAIGGPNRMCAFDLKPHTELACSYVEDQCGLSYLGCSVTTPDGHLVWTPHFDIPSHPFYEPTFWRMRSVGETRQALRDLARVFGGDCTWSDFFEIFPPANLDMDRAVLPDAEGFVVYNRMTAFGNPNQYVYCKAKTWMYYVLHKIRPSNIPSILRMPQQFGNAFPGYRAVQSFFGEGVSRIESMVDDLCAFVMSPEMLNSIEGKAFNALQRATADVAFKIVLNNARGPWSKGSLQVAEKYFAAFALHVDDSESSIDEDVSSLSEKREAAANLLRSTLMTLECFSDNWKYNLAREFNIDEISRSGKMSKVPDMLWSFIYSYGEE